MRFLHLVWRNLCRRKLRTLFTFLSILVAFILFGFLSAITAAFSLGVEVAGIDRLLLIHKVSIIQPLPESYGARILAVDGVEAAAHATWFGGVYQDARNFFAQMAVEPEAWLDMYPEFTLSDAERRAWASNRIGAIAGRDLAERFGWKVGDRVPIQGTIWRQRDTDTWEFVIEGIYDGAVGVDRTQFFFQYDYLDEGRTFGDGIVGWYVIRIADPDRAPQIAATLDGLFANSSYETKTTTEKAFLQGFANQVGDIGAIMRAVTTAVFFTILLVAGNTMAQSVRERTSELGVLKTLGFSNAVVLVLVLLESCTLAIVGGGLGLAIAYGLILRGDPTGGFLPAFYFPAFDVAVGVALVIGLGLISGLLPGLQAMRLRIVDALRRV